MHCTTAGSYNAMLTNLLDGGSVCGLGPDLVGPIEMPRVRTRSAKGFQKIQAARGFDFAPIFALSSYWKHKFLAPSHGS